MKATHSGRLERWLGTAQVESFSNAMRDWYGPPIPLVGVPGNVHACRGGDFVGRIRGGSEATLLDHGHDIMCRLARATKVRHGLLQTGGFATTTELFAAMRNGKCFTSYYQKVFTTGSVSSVFKAGNTPIAGLAAAAAPGGTVPTSASVGAMYFPNPPSGEKTFITGGWTGAANGQLYATLLYDRIFAVAKTMNSTATEAVTGVPTRYQSTVANAADYAGGNFVFPEVGTALAATAHNWTVCTYNDQGGNASTLPSVVGNASHPVNKVDGPAYTWFMPLASGDTGVKTLTQMQCSALVATGAVDFVIGHPLAWVPQLAIGFPAVTDGIRSAFNLTRVFDDACLALMAVLSAGIASDTRAGSFNLVQG